MIVDLEAIADGARYDVIVVGSGAAGMAAALFAAIDKRKVLLIERTEYLGGSSALSAATVWAPNSHHSDKMGAGDSVEKTAKFLTGVVGNHSDAEMRRAFLESAPEAIATLEQNSEVQFRPYAAHPDYEQDVEGATIRGRALEPLPFDGRALGKAVDRIRPPIPEFTIFGGMMIDRTDITHLLNLRNSRQSFVHATKILARYGRDRLGGRARGTRLLMGNALIGRLLKSLLDRGADIVTEADVTGFKSGADGVEGITMSSRGVSRAVFADKAVVLAAGGFNRHPTRRRDMLDSPVVEYSPAAPGHTGRMQELAEGLGARFGEGALDTAFWTPVSVRKRADGTTAVFPHFVLDRSKPGTVCVDQTGRRFVNESSSYHVFARAMREAHKTAPTIPCFIITDAVGLKKYGLGMVRMGTRNLAPYLADSYLTEGKSVAELAAKLGMPAEVLGESIAEINRAAESGVDPRFGRGTTAYHRHNGDATHPGKNPTLGPITTGPFYAVRLYPGDIGAATGLLIDSHARVLGRDNAPIGRLYACGNEAQSIMGGTYPGPGITLGPAITFAYRAMRHALRGAKA